MPLLHELPPSAASLSASLRDLGYSLETAVADIIDNSISAGATEVDILCDLTKENPTLVIRDDGAGMRPEDLIAAMRHGSRSPLEQRGEHDLGRFGLGMKTASFSQCRQLTVASRRDGELSAAEWDLDLVAERDGWFLKLLDAEEASSLPFVSRLTGPGTMVIWRKLDRLSEEESGPIRDEILNEKLDLLRNHLSLVFHRFLAGEFARRSLTIRVNGLQIKPFDPFCKSNNFTHPLPREVMKVDGKRVEIQAFVLPHHSNLSAREYDFYRTRSDFISNQGAYVYRNGRLMAWGDWFRLVPKGESTKLGRVQIDFPNALDESWTIDIKKSRARPPREVREHLRRLLPKITGSAINVHRGRGQKLFSEVNAPLWERFADQGGVRYSINREHPLVRALAERLGEDDRTGLVLLLDSVTASLPIDMVYSDYSTAPKDVSFVPMANDDVLARLRELRLALYPKSLPSPGDFERVVTSTRLFAGHEDAVRRFIREELS